MIKRAFRFGFFVAFAALLTIGGAAQPAVELAFGYPELEARPMAEWTILAYYGGDNDLESHILNDFNEFELAGGSTEQVRVLVLLDRLPGGYTSETEDWSGARLYEVQADISADQDSLYPPTLDSQPLAELGNIDTGDAQTLIDYLTWGMQAYPAKRYAVALGSHGAAWEGVITDDTAKTILTLPELNAAFSTALQAAGREKFDLLINDACLMASAEYYTAISSQFTFSLGSAELIVSPAMDMTFFTQMLKDTPDIDLRQVGRRLVDEYVTVTAPTKLRSLSTYFTGSLTDMTRFLDVHSAIEAFAALMNSNATEYARVLGRARANTYTYTTFASGTTDIDIGSFMRQVQSLTNDERVIAAAQRVIDQLNAVLIYGNAGAVAASQISHYNIYFPERAADFSADYLTRSNMPMWGAMLQNYYNALESASQDSTGFHPLNTPSVDISGFYPSVASFNTGLEVLLDVEGRNISRGSYTVDLRQTDGTARRLFAAPVLTTVPSLEGEVWKAQNYWTLGFDTRTVRWQASAFALKEAVGTAGNVEHVRQANDGSDAYSLEARYRVTEADEWVDVTVTFGVDGASEYDLRAETVVNRNAETGAAAVVEIPVGAEFQVYQPIVQADGSIAHTPGNIYRWVEGGLIMDEVPAPTGDYDFTVTIEAFGGDSVSDSVTVAVNNDFVIPDLRGHNWSDEFGFILQMPSKIWERVISRFNAYLEIDVVPSNATDAMPDSFQVFINLYPNASDNLEYETRLALRSVGASNDAPINRATVAGREALEFSFLTDGPRGQPWHLRGFGAYDTLRDLTLVFLIVDTNAENPPELIDAFYNQLKTRLIFTPLVERATEWRIEKLTPLIELPVPMTWPRAERGGWFTFASPDVKSTFAAFNTSAAQADQTANGLLEGLFATLPQAQPIDRQSYTAQTHTWEAITYTRSRGTITGRLYTTIADNTAYIARFETLTAEAPSIFAESFENMMDAFTVRSRTVTASYPGLGFTFQRPNPQNIGGWTVSLYEESEDKLFFITDSGEQSIEIYFSRDSDGDLAAIAESVTRSGLVIEGAPEATTFNNRDVLEFNVSLVEPDGDVWSGRYMAYYDAEKQLGVAIGARTINEVSAVSSGELYSQMRDSLTFVEGALALSVPLETKTTEVALQEVLGMTANVPAVWEPAIVDLALREGIDRVRLTTGSRWIDIYAIRNMPADFGPLGIAKHFYEVRGWEMFDEAQMRPIVVDGREGVEYRYSDDYYDGAWFVIYDNERENGLMFDVYTEKGSANENWGELYTELITSLRLLPLQE